MSTGASQEALPGGISRNIADFDVDGMDKATLADTTAGRRRTLNPSALRELIPIDGLREYWYPAIVEHKVGRRRPTKIKLLSEDVVLYRDKAGKVVACAAVCPHRGGSMGDGHCHYSGTISCPYHGWTFDETGNCVAVLGEGPESPIPGNEGARLKMFPTVILKGLVFIWMGQRDPAPPEEDIPAQFFEDEMNVQFSVSNWQCNWRQAIENLFDAHVFYVHHNSAKWLVQNSGEQYLIGSKMGTTRGRPRIINNRAVRLASGTRPLSLDENAPYREAYPGLDGQRWPKVEFRYRWAKAMQPFARFRAKPDPERPWVKNDEWNGFHMPSIFQNDHGSAMYTRQAVPVSADQTRVFYFHSTVAHTDADRFWDRMWFTFVQNWSQNYNFSGQDQAVMEPQNYNQPEALSATDIFPLAVRRVIVERARDFLELKPGD